MGKTQTKNQILWKSEKQYRDMPVLGIVIFFLQGKLPVLHYLCMCSACVCVRENRRARQKTDDRQINMHNCTNLILGRKTLTWSSWFQSLGWPPLAPLKLLWDRLEYKSNHFYDEYYLSDWLTDWLTDWLSLTHTHTHTHTHTGGGGTRFKTSATSTTSCMLLTHLLTLSGQIPDLNVTGTEALEKKIN